MHHEAREMIMTMNDEKNECFLNTDLHIDLRSTSGSGIHGFGCWTSRARWWLFYLQRWRRRFHNNHLYWSKRRKENKEKNKKDNKRNTKIWISDKLMIHWLLILKDSRGESFFYFFHLLFSKKKSFCYAKQFEWRSIENYSS